MSRAFFYFSFAGVAVVLQTALLPVVLPAPYKPDMILILVVYLGLHEEPWRGGLLAYLLGCCYDGVAGGFPGLNGFLLLGIFLAVRGIVTRVNTESSPLLLLLVAAGTLLQTIQAAFALDFFSHVDGVWTLLFRQLPLQLLLNFLTAFVLLQLIVRIQKIFMPRRDLPGLRKLDSHYES
ncbi:MAG: rod shape-determining protein MreD [Desulfuromonadales bacterium]|nr:rod shape-determining protein MreD [Desulfuromonadales bacterium]